jgi:predicted permease
MRISDKLPSGIRRLFRLPLTRARRMRDLDDEIRFHIESHVDRLRAEGMSEEAAMTAALRRFGDRDDLRAYCSTLAARHEPARRFRRWFDELAQDLRFAFRQIRCAPGVAATAVLILAIGIGATTGVYSVVHHLLIDPLPFPDGNRMVTLNSMTGRGQVYVTPNRKLLEAWRDRSKVVEQTLIYEGLALTLGDTSRSLHSSSATLANELSAAAVPPSLFAFLGTKPIRGRPILPSDTLADATPVVLFAERVWRTRFGGTDIVGTKVNLSGTLHTVIGILPEGFGIPFTFSETDGEEAIVALHRRVTGGRAGAIGKLQPGRTIGDANREAAALFPPKSELNTYSEPARISRQVDLVGKSRKQMILMLFGAVALVLLIACANVANLLMVRSWSRQREFAVRTALGAGRRRIARHVLTESLVLSLLAGALGFGLSFLALDGIRAALPNGARDYSDVHLDAAALLWSTTLAVVTGLLFGLLPALGAARSNANESLKAGAHTAVGSVGARRVRTAFVVVEVALSVVLLSGAGLLVRTLGALRHVDPGFQSHGLVTAEVPLVAKSLADTGVRRAAVSAALAAVRGIPGVRGALFVPIGPPDLGITMGGLEVEGRVTAPADSLQTVALGMGPAEMFAFAGIPIRRGQTFSRASDNEIIINESLARRLWPNGDALGARMRRSHDEWKTVVGIVGDVRLPGKEAANPRLNVDLQLYLPAPSIPSRSTSLMVRSDLPLASLTAGIQQALHHAHPALKLGEVTTADSVIEKSFAAQRFVLNLPGTFALLAVVLAAIGLHAVISYDVARRTREIGVRVALGAQSRDVTSLVIGRSLRVAAVGVLVGVGGAVAAAQALRALLYGVRPADPMTLSVIGAALLGIAVAATYAPARRATKLDPVEALRAD